MEINNPHTNSPELHVLHKNHIEWPTKGIGIQYWNFPSFIRMSLHLVMTLHTSQCSQGILCHLNPWRDNVHWYVQLGCGLKTSWLFIYPIILLPPSQIIICFSDLGWDKARSLLIKIVVSMVLKIETTTTPKHPGSHDVKRLLDIEGFVWFFLIMRLLTRAYKQTIALRPKIIYMRSGTITLGRRE